MCLVFTFPGKMCEILNKITSLFFFFSIHLDESFIGQLFIFHVIYYHFT